MGVLERQNDTVKSEIMATCKVILPGTFYRVKF